MKIGLQQFFKFIFLGKIWTNCGKQLSFYHIVVCICCYHRSNTSNVTDYVGIEEYDTSEIKDDLVSGKWKCMYDNLSRDT